MLVPALIIAAALVFVGLVLDHNLSKLRAELWESRAQERAKEPTAHPRN